MEESSLLLNSIDIHQMQAQREHNVPFSDNTFKPFIFFGQRIPKLYRVGLYLHLFIVVIQNFFVNTQIILDLALNRSFRKYSKMISHPLS